MRRFALPAILWLLLPALVARADDATASAALAKLFAARGPAPGRYGVLVADATTGAVVFDRDGPVTRTPASTLKIVTTAAAWLLLTPEYRLTTAAVAAGEPSADGVLAGDLVIVGGGDPTLEVTAATGEAPGKVDELAREVSRRGVRRIDGDLVLDEGLFDAMLRHPDWPADQLYLWYCAAVSALTVGRSCVTIEVLPGAAPGDPGRLTLRPPVTVLTLVNETRTVEEKKDHVVIVDPPGADGTIRVHGGVWKSSTGFTAEVAIPDPAAVFGDAFHQALVRAGVALRGQVVRRPGAAKALGNPVEIARVSTDLAEVIRVANQRSQNLFAECLLKLLGAVKGGEGSFAAGAAVAAGLAALSGAPPEELRQVDGSGLSRQNRVSPNYLVKVLVHVYRATPQPERFLATLAAGGEEYGSLRKRLEDLGNNVRAKTGTISGVSALAGYVRTKSGRVAAFAVLVNDPKLALDKSRSLQDEVCRILWREL